MTDINSPVRIGFDHLDPLPVFSQALAHDAIMLTYIAQGAGGGNPQFIVEFRDRETAERFLAAVLTPAGLAENGGVDTYIVRKKGGAP